MRKMVNIGYKVALCGLLLISISCKHKGNGQNTEGVLVNVGKVERVNIAYYETYPGTIVSLNQVELRGQVNGYVTGLFFTDAQEVKKGQKLYEIDRSKYAATVQQAKANVEIATSNLEKAQRDAERYTKLGEQDAVAKQRLEYAMTDLQNVRLQLASAKAELSKAQIDLKYSVITAPFDGTIGISQVRTGTLVVSGQTLLNTISSDDPMAVDFVVDEKVMGRFLTLSRKSATKVDSTFKLVLPDKSFYPLNGKIQLIDRAVDPQTGTIKVRLNFPNKDRILRTGMSCNVQVLNENAGEQLVIPFKSVVEQMGEYFVYLVSGNKVNQTRISLGVRVGDKITISKGVQQGDVIVVEGVQRLRDEAVIKIAVPGKSAEGHVKK
jgi:RND family efflux transporter MFP subunit